MKRLLLLLLLPLPLFARNYQTWNTDTLNIHLGRKVLFSGQTQFRYTSKLYYKHYQATLTFIRSPHILVTPGYRQVYIRLKGGWAVEHYPLFDLTLQTSTKSRWFISNRCRIVYRILGEELGGHNLWLYRNRLEFLTPFRFTRRGIAPFISDEFFWEESHGINENRFIFGFRIPYHQRTQLDLYYLLRSLKKSENQNILGIHFSLHF